MPYKDSAKYAAWEASHPDRRKDRHKTTRQLRNPISPASFASTGRFIAVDGEGAYADPDLRQRYVLLSDSTNRGIWQDRGLSTSQCLDFLLGLSKCGIVVGFGLNYDIAHWLRDLQPKDFRRDADHRYVPRGRAKYGLFGERSETYWGAYKLRWIPNRFFEVWRCRQGNHDGQDGWHTSSCFRRENGPTYVRVEDVLSNFQGGFEKVVDEWLPPTAPSGLLAWGKAARVHFRIEDRPRICQYNAEENQLLVKVMEQYQKVRHQVGFRASKFYSPAVLAKELLRKNGARAYVNAARPPEVEAAQMCAFFGGRIELGRMGRTVEELYSYDLTSAYPAVIEQLPNFARGRWEEESKIRSGSRWSLYHFRWDFVTEDRLYFPFPFRTEKSSIRFPNIATGWAWGRELEAAIASTEHVNRRLTILDGWHFVPEDPEERPFAWIRETFEERARRKAAEDRSEYPLKIAMNAIYGSLAQSISFDRTRATYTDFALAGLVTSETRARLYAAASRNMASVISFNTDELYTTDGHLLPDSEIGTDLGQFKRTVWDEGIFVMPGIYQLFSGRQPGKYVDVRSLSHGAFEEWKERTTETRARGVGERSLPFSAILGAWHSRLPRLPYTLIRPRFVGARLALARGDFDSRFDWAEVLRHANLRRPSLKRGTIPESADPSQDLVDTKANSDGFVWEDESSPYRPKDWVRSSEQLLEDALDRSAERGEALL
jgi:hypothetical protein